MNLAELSELSKLVLGETWVKHHPLLSIQRKGGVKVTLPPRYRKRLGRLVLPKLPRKLKKRFLSNPGGFKPTLESVYIYFYVKWLQPRLDAAMDKAFDDGLNALLQKEDQSMLKLMEKARSAKL